jgi:plasmid maintenance system antidote protein VapI
MNYEELIRNIGKAGLKINSFAELIKTNKNSITNLSGKDNVPKHLAIIATLLGEMVDKDVEYKHLFEKMDLEPQKARGKGSFSKKKELTN